jgi:hypothetical protein
VVEAETPSQFPERALIQTVLEPIVLCTLVRCCCCRDEAVRNG